MTQCTRVYKHTSAYLDLEGERGSEPTLCRKGWVGVCASGKSAAKEWRFGREEEVRGSLREGGWLGRGLCCVCVCVCVCVCNTVCARLEFSLQL